MSPHSESTAKPRPPTLLDMSYYCLYFPFSFQCRMEILLFHAFDQNLASHVQRFENFSSLSVCYGSTIRCRQAMGH